MNLKTVHFKDLTIDELFHLFQDEFDSDFIRREMNHSKSSADYELLYKEKGIYLSISNEEIRSIKIYLSPNPICMAYTGQLMNGLSVTTNETQMVKNPEFQKMKDNDPNRLVNCYIKEHLSMAFDSMTGEILFIEIK